jgi:hypothetical protein
MCGVVSKRGIKASMFVDDYEMLAEVTSCFSVFLTFAATWVTRSKFCYVPDNVVDHDPAIICARMLLDLLYRHS